LEKKEKKEKNKKTKHFGCKEELQMFLQPTDETLTT